MYFSEILRSGLPLDSDYHRSARRRFDYFFSSNFFKKLLGTFNFQDFGSDFVSHSHLLLSLLCHLLSQPPQEAETIAEKRSKFGTELGYLYI